MADLSSLSFRPAGLGGFNKKDVTAYIKTLSDKHASDIKALEKSLSASEEQNSALTDELSETQKERDTLRALAGDSESVLGALQASLDESQKEAASLKDMLDAAEKALEEIRERAEQLEAENVSLRAEKKEADAALSRLEKEKQVVTQLELEARIRAHDTEEAARSRIASVVSAYQMEFSEAKASFSRYKTAADKLINSTEGQLQDMLKLFGSLESELELSEKTINNLSVDPTADPQ